VCFNQYDRFLLLLEEWTWASNIVQRHNSCLSVSRTEEFSFPREAIPFRALLSTSAFNWGAFSKALNLSISQPFSGSFIGPPESTSLLQPSLIAGINCELVEPNIELIT
jgi:hypothetical protein